MPRWGSINGFGEMPALIEGMPMWRNPMPWKNSAETPNIGKWAETDDIRPGMGWGGLENLGHFVEQGGVLLASNNSAEFAITYGLAHGVGISSAPRSTLDGTLLRTKLVDETSPIVYGVMDNLAEIGRAHV